jgi:hypothetical protein
LVGQEIFLSGACVMPQKTGFLAAKAGARGWIWHHLAQLGRRFCGTPVTRWLNATVPLDLLVEGMSNPEICERLVITDATTKTHVARILQKLGVRDRVQVVIYAYKNRLVTPGSSDQNHPWN